MDGDLLAYVHSRNRGDLSSEHAAAVITPDSEPPPIAELAHPDEAMTKAAELVAQHCLDVPITSLPNAPREKPARLMPSSQASDPGYGEITLIEASAPALQNPRLVVSDVSLLTVFPRLFDAVPDSCLDDGVEHAEPDDEQDRSHK